MTYKMLSICHEVGYELCSITYPRCDVPFHPQSLTLHVLITILKLNDDLHFPPTDIAIQLLVRPQCILIRLRRPVQPRMLNIGLDLGIVIHTVNINRLLFLLHFAPRDLALVFLLSMHLISNSKPQTTISFTHYIELIFSLLVLYILIDLLKPSGERAPSFRSWTMPNENVTVIRC